VFVNSFFVFFIKNIDIFNHFYYNVSIFSNKRVDGTIMEINLSALEIRILLKCSQELMSKTAFSQLSRQDGKAKKEKALNNLIKQDYIVAKELPRLGSNKTPVFYEITDKGRKWVKQYLDNYPK
jgi:hypothetical protein